MLNKLSQLRELDGVEVKAEECVKAENLYGMDLEDKRGIFEEILPQEEFIDRRVSDGYKTDLIKKIRLKKIILFP